MSGDFSSPVDWDLAVRLGTRIAGDGPRAELGEATAAVAELREGAARSTAYVADFTGLSAPPGTAPVLVTGRPGWVQANADGFARIIDPVAARLTRRPDRVSHPVNGLVTAVGSRVTGVEVGSLLGFLASRVLGQFDPFFDPYGRLLLVAPNIVHAERQLQVVPADFRLWVCLHEETHRVQFTAVPWLRDHLFSEIKLLTDSVGSGGLFGDGFRRASEIIKSDSGSLLEMLGTPQQRATLDRLTGVMSLLEGHADVVMDGVGPSVIPTVRDIRQKFSRRRQGVGTLDRLLRRLLGMDAKMAQYRDGALFVRRVADTVGMAGFNAIWAEPAHLPSKAEIADPAAWVARVHS
jgi:coenzyme F420 biosynthesis associated uncharacterized protein